MPRCLSLAFAFLLAFRFTAAAQPAEPVDLRPKWEAGHTSRYHFWTDRLQKRSLSAQGQTREVSSKVESEGELTWTVERVRPDGSATCTMTLDWMTANITTPDGKVQRNDSRRGSGDSEAIHDLLRAMSSVPLTVEVAADGTITKLSNVDAMRQRAKNKEIVPEELDFMESASDLATLPGAPASLSPGGSYKKSYKWTHDMGFIHHDATYRLVNVEDISGIPVANVSATSRMRLELDRSQIPEGAPPLDVKLTRGEYEAQIMFDLTRHEAVGRNSTESRVIDITMRLPQQTVTQRLEETITSQTLRIEER